MSVCHVGEAVTFQLSIATPFLPFSPFCLFSAPHPPLETILRTCGSAEPGHQTGSVHSEVQNNLSQTSKTTKWPAVHFLSGHSLGLLWVFCLMNINVGLWSKCHNTILTAKNEDLWKLPWLLGYLFIKRAPVQL